ncbi:hypothetical protein [Tamlana crocina]|uniref:Conjugal transfer protein TraG n=1 Tax=Tamlana crocina TaxID=393006 RepID=A0ABX1DA01_9FLAO|nr:hypothetical protein [Tamlana crocina]NJX15176.1 hypothetical protein [Tamlana crocina]
MFPEKIKTAYKYFIFALVLLPNVFVMVFGIESFPYTCAPMFGHYIDSNTNLYLLKFEGVKDSIATNLTDYYGKPDEFFIRHFFSKVYGSAEDISPFTDKLSENPEAFQNRMDEFFNGFNKNMLDKHNLSFDKIVLRTVKVNHNREPQSESKIIGYFDTKTKSYVSAYQTSK